MAVAEAIEEVPPPAFATRILGQLPPEILQGAK